jgi:hypothetical protein
LDADHDVLKIPVADGAVLDDEAASKVSRV